MIRPLTILCIALALSAMLGCGNKGPLYLPDDPPQSEPTETAVDEEDEASREDGAP